MGRGSSSRNGFTRARQATPQPTGGNDGTQGAGGGGGTASSDADAQARFMAMDDAQLRQFMGGLPSSSDMRANGLNSNELNKVTYALGMNEKPTVLDNATWDAKVQTDALDGVHIWRGVYGNGSMSSSDISNNMRSNDLTFQGDGIHGDGLYFTTQFSYARSYSDGKTNSITKAFIDKSKAKPVNETKLRSMQRNETSSQLRYMDISTYGVYKGYNVIVARGGNGSTSHKNGGQDFYVALTRSVLTIRDTSR